MAYHNYPLLLLFKTLAASQRTVRLHVTYIVVVMIVLLWLFLLHNPSPSHLHVQADLDISKYKKTKNTTNLITNL